MEEKKKEQSVPPQEPQEVVLQYVAEPKSVVSYYVQPQALAGGREEQPAVTAAEVRRMHRGLRIFCVLLALVLVCTGGALWYFRDSLSEVLFGSGGGDRQTEYDEPEISLQRYPSGGEARLLYHTDHGPELSAQEVYLRVSPSTVAVAAELGRAGSDPAGASVGTGIILSQDGYILTNYHVIDHSKRCYVLLFDGRQYEAKLVGFSAEEDVAVLKIEASGLTGAEFGDSELLCIGEPVYAIGNPLGLELFSTLTDGIVSAVNRSIAVEDTVLTVIQTNAALNFGNSGGPLINRYGQVVGMNTMKMGSNYDDTADAEGLGFALPASSIAYMVNDIVRRGEVYGEGLLGIRVLREAAQLPDGTTGLLIDEVNAGGPGEKAGLQPDDVITAAAGEPVSTTQELLRLRRAFGAGDEFPVRVFRKGRYLDLTVVLERDG